MKNVNVNETAASAQPASSHEKQRHPLSQDVEHFAFRRIAIRHLADEETDLTARFHYREHSSHLPRSR